MLEQVVTELRTTYPDRAIETDFARCPRCRSTATASAACCPTCWATRCTTATPDRAGARRTEMRTAVRVSVANSGTPIPPEIAQGPVQAVLRGTDPPQGLGLGLYIASSIARVHGGTLTDSTPEETRFTFRMRRRCTPLQRLPEKKHV